MKRKPFSSSSFLRINLFHTVPAQRLQGVPRRNRSAFSSGKNPADGDQPLSGISMSPRSQNSWYPHTATSASFSAAAVNRRWNIFRSTMSSGSTKPIYVPAAASMPLFLAAETPLFFWSIIRTRRSLFRHSRNISAVRSEEPSLTQMISISSMLWPVRLSIHWSR